MYSNGFDDSAELKLKQEQATVTEFESFYRKTKEIFSLNHEFFEAIAKTLSAKDVLTAADIQQIQKNYKMVLAGI